ncbi:MAG: DUF481 domain-containing protein [Myxococcales bacterium]|nr:DUF481 domain-containing protein [Myxococcales bacterium]
MSRSRHLALAGALATLAALGPRPAAADIVNIEARRPTLPSERKDGWSGSFALKFAFRTGNLFLIDIGPNGTVNWLRGRHSVLSLFSYNFAAKADPKSGQSINDLGRQDSAFRHNGLGHLRYAFEVLRWLDVEAYTQLATDQFLLLRTRYLVGFGPRFALFEDDLFGAYLGTSYYAEHERLDPDQFLLQPGGQGPTNWWHRWSNYLTLRLRATESLLLTSITYVQPRFDRLRDVYLLNDSVLEFKVSPYISFTLSTSIRFDSAPPTYCTGEADPAGSCPSASVYTLPTTDVRVENALLVSF